MGQYLTDPREFSIRQLLERPCSRLGPAVEWLKATDLRISTSRRRALAALRGCKLRWSVRRVHDTWAAGLEIGVKFYVRAGTFVYLTPEYNWFFRHAKGVNNEFSDGQFNWTVGVGLSF